MQSGGIDAVIEAASSLAASGRHPIIAFANSAFEELTINWTVALERLGIRHYLVITLDPEIERYLADRGFPTVYLPPSGTEHPGDPGFLKSLWLHRLVVFQQLAANGIDFIHSDVDAIWFRDPSRLLSEHARFDLLFSSGTNFPNNVASKLGFVVCCGFFFARASAATARFFFRALADARRTGDDQVSFNRLLSGENFTWDAITDAYPMKKSSGFVDDTDDGAYLCSRSLITGFSEKDALRVAVLPHHQFQRIPQEGDAPYVRHLLAPRDLPKRKQSLSEHGCWLLKDDWRQTDFDRDTLDDLLAQERST